MSCKKSFFIRFLCLGLQKSDKSITLAIILLCLYWRFMLLTPFGLDYFAHNYSHVVWSLVQTFSTQNYTIVVYLYKMLRCSLPIWCCDWLREPWEICSPDLCNQLRCIKSTYHILSNRTVLPIELPQLYSHQIEDIFSFKIPFTEWKSDYFWLRYGHFCVTTTPFSITTAPYYCLTARRFY